MKKLGTEIPLPAFLYSVPVQFHPQFLNERGPFLSSLGGLQQQNGAVLLGRRPLHPGVEVLPAHVALHHSGAVFLIVPLVELPSLLALELILKHRSGAHLPASLGLLTGAMRSQ